MITSVPASFSSIWNELNVGFTSLSAPTATMSIFDMTYHLELASPTIYAWQPSTIDCSPFLRDMLTLKPTRGATGCDNGARISAAVGVKLDDDSVRQFEVALWHEPLSWSGFSTDMPRVRDIEEGDTQYLAVYNPSKDIIKVLFHTVDGVREIRIYTGSTYFRMLRINPDDVEGVHTIEVCLRDEVVTYNVCPKSGGRRLLWLSRSGTLESYTFHTTLKTTLERSKNGGFELFGGVLPRAVESMERVVVRSDYHDMGMIDVMAEIFESPAVWCMEDDEWVRVVVDQPFLEIDRSGDFSSLKLTYCVAR